MVNKVWYSNSPPNLLIGPFENRTKCPKSQMSRFRVFSIQMVTVLKLPMHSRLTLIPESLIMSASDKFSDQSNAAEFRSLLIGSYKSSKHLIGCYNCSKHLIGRLPLATMT